MLRSILIAAALLTPLAVRAQNGDKAGETQSEVVPAALIPPAPVLTPEQQIQSFRLPPGFTAEVVAAEPLVRTPVAMQFDPRGRLWVVEMSGYMRTPDGGGESEPNGSVVILDDRDGDGRMDQRTVFAEGLVMPRSLMLFQDGALVAEPPRVWFLRDADGDGKAEEKVLVFTDYASQNDPALGAKSNPEHASNGLLRALDNWVYSANHTLRYRHLGGSPTNWIRTETPFRGQWGISQDDDGRLYFNSNSDQIRADLLPAAQLIRNPNLKTPFGINAQLADSQKVWPGRVTPGVNRGYQPNTLNRDGRLAQFTAACSPLVYRGDQFPAEFVGDVFLCEPSANLIRRNRIVDEDGVLKATNAHPESEFLTSTDERFRPVALQNGPDGTLYIADMARGLIQHRIYLTSYLRKQIESRQLQAPADLGRIYRIVHSGRAVARKDALSPRPGLAELQSRLSSPNGFWRDTAQRLLVEKREPGTEVAMAGVLGSATASAFGRLHALWTLEGLGALKATHFARALEDPDNRVRTAALRVYGSLPPGDERKAATETLLHRAGFVREASHAQFLLTLGDVGGESAEAVMKVLLMNGPPSRLRFDAAISGLKGRELPFLQLLVSDPLCGASRKDHAPLVSGLVRCIANAGDAESIAATLKLAGRRVSVDWQMLAILDGFLGLVPDAKGAAARFRPLTLASEPIAMKDLARFDDPAVVQRVQRLGKLFTWPGKAVSADEPAVAAVQPLAGAELESFNRGKEIYPTLCGACHQPHGRGQEGLAPPLVDSEWSLGSEQRLVRIVLHGVRDAIMVKGVKYELNMPALAEALDDQQIADVLTYIRREWGHGSAPVKLETVQSIRGKESKREDSWTQTELLRIP